MLRREAVIGARTKALPEAHIDETSQRNPGGVNFGVRSHIQQDPAHAPGFKGHFRYFAYLKSRSIIGGKPSLRASIIMLTGSTIKPRMRWDTRKDRKPLTAVIRWGWSLCFAILKLYSNTLQLPIWRSCKPRSVFVKILNTGMAYWIVRWGL